MCVLAEATLPMPMCVKCQVADSWRGESQKLWKKRANGSDAAPLAQPGAAQAIYLLWLPSLTGVISILTGDVAMNFLVPAKSRKSETLNR